MVALPLDTAESPDQAAYRRRLIGSLTFEVVPLKSIDSALAALPSGASVSVTCSPAKGIETTQRLAEQVMKGGHKAIPHLAARMVNGPAHAAELARWLRTEGIERVFVVGGDAEPPVHYDNATDFIADLLAADPGVTAVGVTAYPDGHSAIPAPVLQSALLAKQELLAEAGVDGWASTQMCFSPERITGWLTQTRNAGVTLPFHLGIPGPVERTKLLTLGTRIGIGTSIGYLRKNRRAVTGLIGRSHYDPNDLLVPLSPWLESSGVTGLHCFTFNQVEATESWRASHES